jgi:hypothetical protein
MKIERLLNDIHIPTRAKYFSTQQLLFVLSFVKRCVQLSFEIFSKMICYPHYLLASPRNIGVHTSALECVHHRYIHNSHISIIMV